MKILDKEISDDLPVFQKDIEVKKILMEGLEKDEYAFDLRGVTQFDKSGKESFEVKTIEVIKR